MVRRKEKKKVQKTPDKGSRYPVSRLKGEIMRLLRKGTPDLSSSEKERDHFRKGQEEKRPTEKPTTEKSITVVGPEKDLYNSKRSWHFTHAH